MRFAVIVHKEEEGGYWAEVPDLPGCFTQGDTLEELEENLKSAIVLMLDSPDPDWEPQFGWGGDFGNYRLGELVEVTV